MTGTCGNCAAPLEAGTKFCGTCGSAVAAPTDSPQVTSPFPGRDSSVSHSRRYPALRIIAMLIKIFAVLTAIGGAITGLSAAALTSSLPPYPGIATSSIGSAGSAIGWSIFLVGLCYALFLWASAEMIHVLIDIEQNTRRSAGITA